MKCNVVLLDIDSKIPNLALMRVSTWHKQRGDSVTFGYDPLLHKPDLCYASKIFSYTAEPLHMPDCETLKGGSVSFEEYEPWRKYNEQVL